MNEVKREKLKKAIFECEMHLKRLSYAHKSINSFFPVDEDQYLNLSDEQVQEIDQYIYRFSKLQDTIGLRLFRAVLDVLEEDILNKSFIDILNRLEQLKLLESKENWQYLRNLRNELAHDYPDETEISVDFLNELVENYSLLTGIYLKIKNFLETNSNTSIYIT